MDRIDRSFPATTVPNLADNQRNPSTQPALWGELIESEHMRGDTARAIKILCEQRELIPLQTARDLLTNSFQRDSDTEAAFRTAIYQRVIRDHSRRITRLDALLNKPELMGFAATHGDPGRWSEQLWLHINQCAQRALDDAVDWKLPESTTTALCQILDGSLQGRFGDDAAGPAMTTIDDAREQVTVAASRQTQHELYLYQQRQIDSFSDRVKQWLGGP